MPTYRSDGRPMKKLHKTPPMRDATPVTTKTLDGQHLLVRPDVTCAECGKVPERPTLVQLCGRLLCPKCYREAAPEGAAKKKRKGGR